MIEIKNLTKHFDRICAVNDVSLDIPDGIMFGIQGTNGAGKTTLLRILAGILQADAGTVCIDGEKRIGLRSCKEKLFFLPDTPYYFPNATLEGMAEFYAGQYPGMDREGVSGMAESLDLDMHRPLRTFSKGMKRQAFLILALCAGTKYLLCDEVFDGLDPIVTEVMKNLFRREMQERSFTVAVASHKLNDLEDICGSIGILHKGGLVTARDMKENAGEIHKYQCVFPEDADIRPLSIREETVKCTVDGYFVTLVIKGKGQVTEAMIRTWNPVFFKEVPMTLEETFIAEMEGKGYDIRKVLQ